VLVVENGNHRELHQGNGEYITRMFGENARCVMVDTTDPLKTADALKSSIRHCITAACKHIVVDITAFTRESLLILYGLLMSDPVKAHVTFVYATAKEYSVGEPLESKWLSRGVADVRSVLGYPGELLPTKKCHLIVLVGGFEHERVTELIRQCEPSVISLGYSRSSDVNGAWLQNECDRNFDIIKAIYRDAYDFAFPWEDPFGTKDAILKQRIVAPDHNLIVSSFSTKISVIGVAMAAVSDPSMQICYAEASLYNSRNYSSPGDTFYSFDVKCG
jgi:hypothetical protein